MNNESSGAVTPAIDMAAFSAAIGAAISERLQPITDAIVKMQPPADKSKEAPLTLESVSKMLDDRDKSRASQQNAQRDRDSFLSEKMKDLPAIYRNQLGGDPAKWAAEEQQIRESYKTDFKAAGGTVPNVSGDPPAGAAKPGAVTDMSKMSPGDKIALGLKTAKPTMLGDATAAAEQKAAPSA